MRRRAEAIRDRIFQGVGTTEPLIEEDYVGMRAAIGSEPVAAHWRKPLSIEEVNRMAQTPEVRERKGRP